MARPARRRRREPIRTLRPAAGRYHASHHRHCARRHRGLFRIAGLAAPQVDFPTISVRAGVSGASPETMASSVATPLERRLGIIADVTEMTSSSGAGSTGVTLQFKLSRDINGAARDVMAAINAARGDLPSALRSNPTYRKFNPADAPVMILALTSTTLSRGQIYEAAANVVQQKLSQVNGVGDVEIGGSSLPAVRVELVPYSLSKYGISLEDVRAAIAAANPNRPRARSRAKAAATSSIAMTMPWSPPTSRISSSRGGTVRRSGSATSPRSSTASKTPARSAWSMASPRSSPSSAASRTPTSSRPWTRSARPCRSWKRTSPAST